MRNPAVRTPNLFVLDHCIQDQFRCFDRGLDLLVQQIGGGYCAPLGIVEGYTICHPSVPRRDRKKYQQNYAGKGDDRPNETGIIGIGHERTIPLTAEKMAWNRDYRDGVPAIRDQSVAARASEQFRNRAA